MTQDVSAVASEVLVSAFSQGLLGGTFFSIFSISCLIEYVASNIVFLDLLDMKLNSFLKWLPYLIIILITFLSKFYSMTQ